MKRVRCAGIPIGGTERSQDSKRESAALNVFCLEHRKTLRQTIDVVVTPKSRERSAGDIRNAPSNDRQTFHSNAGKPDQFTVYFDRNMFTLAATALSKCVCIDPRLLVTMIEESMRKVFPIASTHRTYLVAIRHETFLSVLNDKNRCRGNDWDHAPAKDAVSPGISIVVRGCVGSTRGREATARFRQGSGARLAMKPSVRYQTKTVCPKLDTPMKTVQ